MNLVIRSQSHEFSYPKQQTKKNLTLPWKLILDPGKVLRINI